MGHLMFAKSVEILQERFSALDWTYHDYPGKEAEKMYKWPGDLSEEIIICVHKSSGIQEFFHRHDFFFFNYTYKGRYDSQARNTTIKSPYTKTSSTRDSPLPGMLCTPTTMPKQS